MAATKATISKNKYDKTHMRQYLLKFHLEYDADVIARLDSMESKQGYIRQLIREDIARTHTEKKEKKKMKSISVDNGCSFVSVSEALEKVSLDTIEPCLDDEIREAVNSELAPCTAEEFLTRYLELANEDLIIG